MTSMTEDRGLVSSVLHVELFFSSRTGEPIGVWCDCEIGVGHTYAEWRTRFQDSEDGHGA